MDQTPPELRDKQLRNFFRALRDDDHFTIVYELAYNEKPVTIEALSHIFGASLSCISGILSWLLSLGVAVKVGKRWMISPWARAALQFLEEYANTIVPEVSEPKSDSVTVGVISSATILEPGTYNGLWTASTSRVTASDRITVGAVAGSRDASQKLAPRTPYAGQNETRSHNYK